jgi:hypothetical protein
MYNALGLGGVLYLIPDGTLCADRFGSFLSACAASQPGDTSASTDAHVDRTRENFLLIPGDLLFHEAGVSEDGTESAEEVWVSQLREPVRRSQTGATHKVKAFWLVRQPDGERVFMLDPRPVTIFYGTLILDAQGLPLCTPVDTLPSGCLNAVVQYTLPEEWFETVLERARARLEAADTDLRPATRDESSSDEEDSDSRFRAREADRLATVAADREARTAQLTVMSRTTTAGRQSRNAYGCTNYRELAGGSRPRAAKE